MTKAYSLDPAGAHCPLYWQWSVTTCGGYPF